jgi:molybdate transport system substrate-binding protein
MQKKLRQAIALAAALLMILALAACGTDTTDVVDQSTPPDTGSPSQTSDVPPAPPSTSDPAPVPSPATPEPVELIVFAAASMTETLNEIADLYAAVAPNVTLTFNFDSSGTLLTQIQEGAECDVFISAAQRQMNTLDEANGLLAGTRINLVENKIALVVPEGNPANIHSFDDAANASSIALGNSDVPVGQYSEEIFTNMGVWNDAFLSRVTLGSNVKEVTTWVSEGVVDCGVVYATDAFSAGLEIVADAPAGMLKTPVVYPAAALADTADADAAKAFLDYLRSSEAAAVFESVGFAIPS